MRKVAETGSRFFCLSVVLASILMMAMITGAAYSATLNVPADYDTIQKAINAGHLPEKLDTWSL